MSQRRGFFGGDEYIRVQTAGVIRADISVTKVIDLVVAELPPDIQQNSPRVRTIRRRLRAALLEEQDVIGQLILVMLVELGEIVSLLALLRHDVRVEAGPVVLAKELTEVRREVIATVLSRRGIGKKRPKVVWGEALARQFVSEVDALLPLWREARRQLRETEEIASTGSVAPLPADLVRSMAQRTPNAASSTPLALACEHAARRIDVPNLRSYDRLTLRNIYQRTRRAGGMSARRGRPGKNNISA